MGAEVNKKPAVDGQESEQEEPSDTRKALLNLIEELQRTQTRLGKANLKLDETSKRYRTLFNNANDIVVAHGITDEGLPGKFTEVSKKACKALGYTKKEFFKLGPMDIVPPRRVGNTPAVMKRIFTEKNVLFESFLLTKDGREIPVEVNAHLFDIKGSSVILSICRDITERKKSEKALQESEAKHRAMVHNIPGMVYRGYPDWSAEIISRSEEISGYTSEELNSKEENWLSIIHPDDKGEVLREGSELTMDPKGLVQIYRIITKEGDVRWVEDHKTSLFSEEGEFQGIEGIVLDITERKRAEDALRESEEKFRKYVESSPTAVFIVDEKGNYQFVNDAATRQTRFTEKELLKMSIPQLVHPDAFEKGVSTFPELKKKGKVTEEIALRHKDGSRIEVILDAVKLSETRFLGHTTDISARKMAETALKESEDKLKSIATVALDGIVMMDATGKVVYWNPAAEKMFGYSQKEILNKDMHKLLSPSRYHSSILKGFRKFNKTGKGPFIAHVQEVEAQRKGGQEFPVEISVSKFKKGGHWWAVALIKDITARKKAEEALQASEVKYRSLMENNPDMVFVLEKKSGKIIDVNTPACKLLGYKKEELIGTVSGGRIVPSQRAEYKKQLERLKKTGVYSGEFDVKRKDGSIFTVDVAGSAFGDYLFAIGRDVTSRKKAEDAIRESEEKYRLIAETSVDGIYQIDRSGNFTFINKAFADIFGFRRDELLGKNFLVLADEKSQEAKDYFKRVLSGKIASDELLVKSKEDENLYIYFSAAPIKRNGKVVGVTGILRDVTKHKEMVEELKLAYGEMEKRVEGRTADLSRANRELKKVVEECKIAETALKESEELFRVVTEGALAGVYIVKDNKFEYVNPALAQIFGYTVDELIGKTGPLELTHPEDQARVGEQQRRRLSGEIEAVRYTFRGLKKDGSKIYCEVFSRRIEYKGRQAIMGTLIDETKRVRAEEEMKRRLMKFELDDGHIYLAKEPAQTMCMEAFCDLLDVGYKGLLITRTPEEECRKKIKDDFDFLWVAEKGGPDALSPSLKDIERRLEDMSSRMAVLIDRLDYLIFKNGFDDTLAFVQRLREIAYLRRIIVILSVDPATLGKRELILLDKETQRIEPRHKLSMPSDHLDILKYIYYQNTIGIKPSYSDTGRELKMSKPTLRKKVRRLISGEYALEDLKGSRKVLALTEKGRGLFLK
jgi:PAS domain S-box-containing protein